jgi:SAP domain-containing ribonucleoprotein
VTAAVVPPGSSDVAAPASSMPTNNADQRASEASGVQPQVVSAAESTAKVVDEDDEMAKRRARAARFGIPVVEPKKKPISGATGTQPQSSATESELVSKIKELSSKISYDHPCSGD